jgi:membrane protein DedA with SNARE-associated domain
VSALLVGVVGEHALESVGYPAIFLLAMIEAICIPFPSEVTFGFTAALAAQHEAGLTLAGVILVGVAGEIVGSVIAYWIGRTGGRAVVDRWGKYVLLTHHDLDRADEFMARRGAPAVIIGRMIPLLRAFISLVAGIGEMPFWRFLASTAIGTAIYCTAISLIGYALGDNWHKIQKGFTYASVVVLVVIVAAVAFALWHRWRRVQAARAGAGGEPGV